MFYDISRYLTRQIFWRSLGMPLSPRTPQKSIFWTAWLRVPVYFDMRRYLTEKYFDIVWGCHPPGDPPKLNFLNGSTWDASLFWYLQIFNRQIFWHSLGVPPPFPPGNPPKWSTFWQKVLSRISPFRENRVWNFKTLKQTLQSSLTC